MTIARTIEDDVASAIAMIGVLQGALSPSTLGHEALVKLDEYGLFTEDPEDNMANLFEYMHSTLGGDTLLSVLATLVSSGMLAVDPDRFYKLYEIQGEALGELQ